MSVYKKGIWDSNTFQEYKDTTSYYGGNINLTDVSKEDILDFRGIEGYVIQGENPSPDSVKTIYPISGTQNIYSSGKNLLNLTSIPSATANGLTYSVSNQTVTITGTNTKTDANWGIMYFTPANILKNQLEVGKTYTLSLSGTTGRAYFQINGVNKNTGGAMALASTSSKVTFTVQDNLRSINSIFIGIYANAREMNLSFKVQLEHGSTNTTWEAPTISSAYLINLPSNLLRLGALDNLADCIKKSSGKNLVPTSNFTLTGQVSSAQTIGGIGNTVLVKDIPIKKNTTYLLSWDAPIEVTKPMIWFYSGSMANNTHNGAYNEIVNGGRGLQLEGNTPQTNTSYEYMAVSTGNYSTYAANANVTIKISNLMVREEGTTSDFEPGFPAGTWYTGQTIGKTTYNGSETGWTSWKDTSDYLYYINNSTVKRKMTGLHCISNYLPYQTDVGYVEIGSFSIGGQTSTKNGNILVKPYESLEADLAGFKTWLGTHNLEIYYPLELPVYTKITDTNLIAQLENISKLPLREGITNIGGTFSKMSFGVTKKAMKTQVFDKKVISPEFIEI